MSVLVALSLWQTAACAESVAVVIPTNAAPRVVFGAQRVMAALKAAKFTPVLVHSKPHGEKEILVSESTQHGLSSEAFRLMTMADGSISVTGGDDSGALYGCLELARRIHKTGRLPRDLNYIDAPVMKLRGTCIGLQKTYILPGRHVYEYPITPKLFPWFYNKKLWLDYLNFLVKNRMNTLYLWNGHPFASLVRLKKYPYAVEVPENVFKQNQKMFHWLTRECDKRGIWLVQMFYNILVSKPFAETNHISTQLSAPTSLVSDYTRRSIAKFVKDYPHVGLLVCLGEALRGTANQVEWCTNVILPGVLDGMKEAGLKEEPPVVIRTHAMNPYAIMPAAYQVYSNLYTMTKYNGESLTTWQPRGKDQAIHLAMSQLGPHIVNVHILSNLEPFRYGDVRFIKKCVQAARDRLGAIGVHLYPLSYWNWPYSPDKTQPPLLQWRRDWIWFEAWSRYEWSPDIPAKRDHAYWISQLTAHYGTTNAAERILKAYDDSGEVAPRLIRRFGITEGNRQTLSLGMTLNQLINPHRYGAIEDLWESQAPRGERLGVYVRRQWLHEPHVGETPETVIHAVLAYSSNAVRQANAALPFVTKNRAEFERVRNDVDCIRAMAENYSAKVRAAELVLRFRYSHNIGDMERAEQYLTQSFADYQKLAALADKAYNFANSMQTSQRKIPFPGGHDGVRTNYLWSQLVPRYRQELVDFRAHVKELKEHPNTANSVSAANIKPWPAAPFTLLSTNAQTYTVRVGAKPYTDRYYKITQIAPELRGLTGIRFSHEAAKTGHHQPVEIETREPVRVLVGYFKSSRSIWLQPPELENNARADDRGGVETVLENAALIDQCPNVDVHAFRYGAGRQKLQFGGKGSFVILGIVPQSVKLHSRDVGLGESWSQIK